MRMLLWLQPPSLQGTLQSNTGCLVSLIKERKKKKHKFCSPPTHNNIKKTNNTNTIINNTDTIINNTNTIINNTNTIINNTVTVVNNTDTAWIQVFPFIYIYIYIYINFPPFFTLILILYFSGPALRTHTLIA